MPDQLNRGSARHALALVLRLDAWLAAAATALILCLPGDAPSGDYPSQAWQRYLSGIGASVDQSRY
jgi:hypothetical protein